MSSVFPSKGSLPAFLTEYKLLSQTKLKLDQAVCSVDSHYSHQIQLNKERFRQCTKKLPSVGQVLRYGHGESGDTQKGCVVKRGCSDRVTMGLVILRKAA